MSAYAIPKRIWIESIGTLHSIIDRVVNCMRIFGLHISCCYILAPVFIYLMQLREGIDGSSDLERTNPFLYHHGNLALLSPAITDHRQTTNHHRPPPQRDITALIPAADHANEIHPLNA